MSELDGLERAADWLRRAENVVVFTGAGISAESGIATFRDSGGVWDQFSPDRFATWDGLLATAAAHPRELAEFLLAVLEPLARAVPNPGHRALAEIEKHVPVSIVTQNIDGLHQEAGSTTVFEIHGTLFEIVTLTGRSVRRITRSELREVVEAVRRSLDGWFVLPKLLSAVNPMLGLGPSVHRPRIVLFGEAMAEPDWSRALQAARACDTMLIVGTSCDVYPAATLPEEARRARARIVGVGPEPGDADIWLPGLAGDVLPTLVQNAFERPGPR